MRNAIGGRGNAVFFDTSVLLGGSIEMGPTSAAAHALLDAVANGTILTAAEAAAEL
jgi:hypothetical protein